MGRVVERVQSETEGFHPDADADIQQLLTAVTASDYRRFLIRTLGFVQPLEREIARVRDIDKLIDLRRFEKHQLLRRDLHGFRMKPDEIDRLPECSLPMFDSPAEALGWAFVIERSTLGHSNLFRHLASVLPGDVAFTSAYLKCYFGAVGENWKWFGDALERVANTPQQAQKVVDAAQIAFRVHRHWRHSRDEQMESIGDVREQQRA